MVEKEQRVTPRTFPTSIDVARKAGVSRATVYYALNDENGSRNIHVYRANGHGIALFPPPDSLALVKNAHKFAKTR